MAPTTATVRPAGISKSTPCRIWARRVVGKRHVLEAHIAAPLAPAAAGNAAASGASAISAWLVAMQTEHALHVGQRLLDLAIETPRKFSGMYSWIMKALTSTRSPIVICRSTTPAPRATSSSVTPMAMIRLWPS
jgi:hypothetical protein